MACVWRLFEQPPDFFIIHGTAQCWKGILEYSGLLANFPEHISIQIICSRLDDDSSSFIFNTTRWMKKKSKGNSQICQNHWLLEDPPSLPKTLHGRFPAGTATPKRRGRCRAWHCGQQMRNSMSSLGLCQPRADLLAPTRKSSR